MIRLIIATINKQNWNNSGYVTMLSPPFLFTGGAHSPRNEDKPPAVLMHVLLFVWSYYIFFHFSHNEIPNHSTKHTSFKISCKFRIGIPVWLLSHISAYNGTKQKEVTWITWINIYACFICPTSSPSIKCRNFTIECARLLDMMQINLNPIICYTPHNTICLVEAELQMIRKKSFQSEQDVKTAIIYAQKLFHM